jgi:hypothetical protein
MGSGMLGEGMHVYLNDALTNLSIFVFISFACLLNDLGGIGFY